MVGDLCCVIITVIGAKNKDSCSKSIVKSPKPFFFNESNTFDTTKFTFKFLGPQFIEK